MSAFVALSDSSKSFFFEKLDVLVFIDSLHIEF